MVKKKEKTAAGTNKKEEKVKEKNLVATGASEEYSYTIKIPKDRIAVLIGVKGKDKKELEEYSSANISVDSAEGDVTISGKDAVKLYTLREVVKAIARGFNPETARLLLRPDYMLEVISLREYGLEKKNKLKRVKARIIGTKGKARRAIEELTGTFLSVYGKTISILGECTDVANAKRAIELLIKGSMHATVYKWLEDQRRKARREGEGF
nr:RNA-processing protein [Nanoarchaeota archaeon]